MKTETKKKEVSEPKLDGSKYSCQVILEKCTLEQALDRSLPTDARLIRYNAVSYTHLRAHETV